MLHGLAGFTQAFDHMPGRFQIILYEQYLHGSP
jgi:hypothetical protein